MLASGNAVEACNIVERHRMDGSLNDDRWYVVQLWLEMLPEELRQQRPHLLLSQAWIEYESILNWIESLPF